MTSTGRYPHDDAPDCPYCGHDLFVTSKPVPGDRWYCQYHEVDFGA